MDIYQIFITHNRAWTQRECYVFAIVLFITAIVCFYLVRRKKIAFFQAVAILLALTFLAIVFGSTVFTRNPGTRQYQLEVFWSWKEILGIEPCGRLGSVAPEELLQENLLNMALLMPFGWLLPFMRGRRVAWWKGLLVGALTSLVIELLQLLLCRGLFEFDDIIHNAIGCMVGCIIGGFFYIGVRHREQSVNE